MTILARAYTGWVHTKYTDYKIKIQSKSFFFFNQSNKKNKKTFSNLIDQTRTWHEPYKMVSTLSPKIAQKWIGLNRQL